MNKIDKRKLIISIISGFLFSSFFVLGTQLNRNSAIDFSLKTAVILLTAIIALSIAFYYILSIRIKIKRGTIKSNLWISYFIPLALLSLFLLIAVYPGNYGYDSMFQYHTYISGDYTTHFPALFIVLLGSIINLGKNIFGNYNAGLFIFLLAQSLFINFVISKIIEYLGNKIKNKKFIIISFLFFLLHPLVHILAISSCHDVFFGGFFALLVLEFLKITEEKDYFSKKSNYIKVGFITLFMCLFRNNGFFALIPAVIISFIILKEHRKHFLFMLAIPMLVFQGWNQIYANVIAKEKQSVLHESLNIPIMQIARSLYYNHSKIWSEELNLYFDVKCGWGAYGTFTGISDNFKSCLNDDYVSSHLIDFMAYYIKIGLKSPNRYIEAPGILSLGLYYPWKTYPRGPRAYSNIYHPYIEHIILDASEYFPKNEVAKIERHAAIPLINTFFEKFIDNQGWSRIPIFRFIWGGAFTTYLMIFCICFIFTSKKYKYLVSISLIFGLTLTVFLAPVVLFRYIFPIVLTTPIMFYVLLSCIKK